MMMKWMRSRLGAGDKDVNKRADTTVFTVECALDGLRSLECHSDLP